MYFIYICFSEYIKRQQFFFLQIWFFYIKNESIDKIQKILYLLKNKKKCHIFSEFEFDCKNCLSLKDK